MANKTGSWTGFENVSKAKRYLKKQYDKVFKNNTDEYKQLKDLFKRAEKEGKEVGVLYYECACGWTGEDPVLVALSPEDPQLIKYKSDERIMHLCPNCRELGYFLQHYGLNQKNAEKIFPVILAMKREQDELNQPIQEI